LRHGVQGAQQHHRIETAAERDRQARAEQALPAQNGGYVRFYDIGPGLQRSATSL
jgi:hypothetical protein